MKIVETENLTRIYGSGAAQVNALDGVSLHVNTGEFVAVMGPSGCGKSTLLNMIGGLDHPSDGVVKIEGQDLSSLNDDELTDLRREHIGFIFQILRKGDGVTGVTPSTGRYQHFHRISHSMRTLINLISKHVRGS